MNTITEVVILRKKTAILLFVFFTLTLGLTIRLYTISSNQNISQAAVNQSTYKINVGNFRGTIYDCNNEPMVNNGEINTKAAVLPSINSTNILQNVLSKEDVNSIYRLLSSGKPFLMEIPKSIKKINNQDIQCFDIQDRYKKEGFCSHIIGYINGSGEGVSGIELAYDDYLKNIDSSIYVNYKVDAIGRALPEQSPKINNTEYKKLQGVSLTIDNKIQSIVEEAAQKHIKKGSVIVTEIPNCEIRAALSLPSYSPLDINSALQDESSSTMINRTLSSYDLGSVFKLVTAAAGLEDGLDSEAVYDCKGSITVDGMTFHCFDGVAHGEVNMEKAISYSCNCYFIDLAQKMGYTDIYNLAENLGFNEELELAPNLISSKGSLPSIGKLRLPAAMANFSFGQGDLLATPVQVNGMLNAILSDGIYKKPKLVNGLVDSDFNWVEKSEDNKSKEVISPWYAQKIKQCMIACVEHGTAKDGKPSILGAGAKTGTAQTGSFKDGNEVIQCWYSGFYPAENPKYVITVFTENGISPSNDCAPVFKEIADKLHSIIDN